MISKILIKSIIFFGEKRGYSSWMMKRMLDAVRKDFKTTNLPLNKKIWAYKRGFLSERIIRYNLNDDNYLDYMPDFYYYKLHPINGEYSKWIDDKLTTKYVFQKFNSNLPEYYFLITENGKVEKILDCPKDITNSVEGVIQLLKIKANLALKLVSAAMAVGFYKMSYENEVFYLNNKEISYNEVFNFLKGLKGYIVTEYLVQDGELNNIFAESPTTLRVQTVRLNQETEIIGAFARIPTKKTGVVNNYSSGAVLSGIDIETGKLFDSFVLKDGKNCSIKKHPNTDKVIEETAIEEWESIKILLKQIGEEFPELIYMGYDIIIASTGIKIIEINSLTALTGLPIYYPMLKGKGREFFIEQFRKRPQYYKKILKSLESQEK